MLPKLTVNHVCSLHWRCLTFTIPLSGSSLILLCYIPYVVANVTASQSLRLLLSSVDDPWSLSLIQSPPQSPSGEPDSGHSSVGRGLLTELPFGRGTKVPQLHTSWKGPYPFTRRSAPSGIRGLIPISTFQYPLPRVSPYGFQETKFAKNHVTFYPQTTSVKNP